MAVRVGIGSWTDAEYTGVLYPPGLPASERLTTYAKTFDLVEVNSSYYRTPSATVTSGWARQTPTGFAFNVKLHRAIAQSPARATDGSLVKHLLAAARPLVRAGKLGAFLLVLPPAFSPERHALDELAGVAAALQPHLLAVELRHRAWVAGAKRARTLDHFRELGLVWVGTDMPRIAGSDIMPPVDAVTNPRLAYLRLHGRNPRWLEAKSAAQRHEHAYATGELRQIAMRVRRLAESADDVHVVANNHAHDFAPRAARALQSRLKLSSRTR